MADQNLVRYVAAQLQQGFAPRELQSALLQQGYTATDVTEAMRAARDQRISDLISYIKRSGQPPEEIHEQLHKLGYADEDIQRAFAQMNGATPGQQHHARRFLFVAMLILVLASAAIFVKQLPSEVEQANARVTTKVAPLREANLEARTTPVTPAPAVAPARAPATADTAAAIGLCRGTADAIGRNACFDQLAKSLNDPNLCGEISEDGMRDTCYLTLVLRNKNYALCSSIAEERTRRECSSLAIVR